MSLQRASNRECDFLSKQSPLARGDYSPTLALGARVATCARNDMQDGALRELHKGVILQVKGGEMSCPPSVTIDSRHDETCQVC